VLLLALAWPLALAAQVPASGEARVRDAVTLAIGGVRIRLGGIEAPPEDAACAGGVACAQAARDALSRAVDGQIVACERARRLGHGVYQGACALADGRDPALILLRAGLATPADDASPAYRDAAEAAKAAGVGLYAR